MKILIVANHNKGYYAPFVTEQADALRKRGVEIDYFSVTGKGVIGYLKNRKPLIQKIREFQPDIIHAHYGLCGLLANLQRGVPTVTTYHGSDITNDKIFQLSKLSIRLSAYNIFVSQKNMTRAKSTKPALVIPCGVNMWQFTPRNRDESRAHFGFSASDKLVLFAGAFDNAVKNTPLARQAIGRLQGDVRLIELRGYSREQVADLVNCADAVLMTSFSEGSPQIIKEAMACNRPLVSTDVGDVEWVVGNAEGCYITSYDPYDCATQIEKAIRFSIQHHHTNGRSRITELGLDNCDIALKLLYLYDAILSSKTDDTL